MQIPDDSLLFDIETPLGFRVHCYTAYWTRKVVYQHPAMADRLEEVRLSSSDEAVYLFYTADEKRFVCAVVRQPNGEGFLIAAYPTDKVKQGKIVWTS